jgi:hypothetical protein
VLGSCLDVRARKVTSPRDPAHDETPRKVRRVEVEDDKATPIQQRQRITDVRAIRKKYDKLCAKQGRTAFVTDKYTTKTTLLTKPQIQKASFVLATEVGVLRSILPIVGLEGQITNDMSSLLCRAKALRMEANGRASS